MKTVNVVFHSMEECARYAKEVENFPYNIDLVNGRRVIDGKSMLGILGFGLRKVLEIRMHTEDMELIEELLKRIEFCIYNDNIKMAI